MRLNVFIEQTLVGVLEDEPQTSRFAFTYAPSWLSSPDRFALCPALPLLRPQGETPDSHSVAVRRFFENLLPRAMLSTMWPRPTRSQRPPRRLAGGTRPGNRRALRIHPADVTDAASPGTPEADARPVRRILTKEELSQRIRARPIYRLSCGMAKSDCQLPATRTRLRSTPSKSSGFSLKAQASHPPTSSSPSPCPPSRRLTSNEFLCMRLARRIGLPAAEVELVQVPEPVLVVTRFDRRVVGNVVRRLHVIDAARRSALPPPSSTSAPTGQPRRAAHSRRGIHAAHLRATFDESEPGGATFATATLAHLPSADWQHRCACEEPHVLRRDRGLTIAPAYDLVSVLALEAAPLEATYAMAVGDAFSDEELSAFEWANFAKGCKLTQRLVSNELSRLAEKTLKALPKVKDEALAAGALAAPVHAAGEVIRGQATRQAALAKEVAKVQRDML